MMMMTLSLQVTEDWSAQTETSDWAAASASEQTPQVTTVNYFLALSSQLFSSFAGCSSHQLGRFHQLVIT